MTKSKLIGAYVLLVGFPALGLLGILHAGEHMRSPVSVGGAWHVDADFSTAGNSPCSADLAKIGQPFLSISQSGPQISLTLNDASGTTLAGSLQGRSFVASPSSPPGGASAASDCSGPKQIQLESQVVEEDGHRVLHGLIRFVQCPSCAPISFRASRETVAPKDAH